MMRLVTSFQEQHVDGLSGQSAGALVGAPNLAYLSVAGLNRINTFLMGCVFLGSVLDREFATRLPAATHDFSTRAISSLPISAPPRTISSRTHSQLPTLHYTFLTPYSPRLIPHYTPHSSLLTPRFSLPTPHSPLPTPHSPLPTPPTCLLDLDRSELKILHVKGCERLSLDWLVHDRPTLLSRSPLLAERWYNDGRTPPWPKLEVVDVSLGGPHRAASFPPGALSSLALSRALKEVDITGCEGVNDDDLLNLAACCSVTLEAFTARACTFGGGGVAGLALCKRLSLLDISACFQVTSQDYAKVALVSNTL